MVPFYWIVISKSDIANHDDFDNARNFGSVTK